MEKPGTTLGAHTHLAEKGDDFIHRPLTPPAAETRAGGRARHILMSVLPLFVRGPGAPRPGSQCAPLTHPPQPCQPEGGAPTEVSGSTPSGGSHTPSRGTRRPSSHGLPLIRPLVGEETGTRVRLEVTQDTLRSSLSPSGYVLSVSNVEPKPLLSWTLKPKECDLRHLFWETPNGTSQLRGCRGGECSRGGWPGCGWVTGP